MSRITGLLAIYLLVLSCSNNINDSYLTYEGAGWYFDHIRELCERDAGALWGSNLYGPLMLVDQQTRFVVANSPDAEDMLRQRNGVYTGFFPRERLINVVPTEYGGTIFAMVPLPSGEDTLRIITRALHSLVHLEQRERGLEPPPYNNRHMREDDARMWLKLEWRALARAIRSSDERRVVAIRDALIFRGARHQAYPSSQKDEVRFENFEGMALYTYEKLLSESDNAFKGRLLELLNRHYRLNSFSDSFGFINGALYTYLLTEMGFTPSMLDDIGADLGALTATMYDISIPETPRDIAGSIALNYNIDRIVEEEAARERRRQEIIERELSQFTTRPVLYFDLESPSFSFEPDDPNTLDTLGTIYTNLRVSDTWGKLTVTGGGCLVLHNLKEMRVSAGSIRIRNNSVTGNGWSLHLNDRWGVTKEDNNYYLRMGIP